MSNGHSTHSGQHTTKRRLILAAVIVVVAIVVLDHLLARPNAPSPATPAASETSGHR